MYLFVHVNEFVLNVNSEHLTTGFDSCTKNYLQVSLEFTILI